MTIVLKGFCDVRLDEERSKAVQPEEKAEWMKEKKLHISRCLMDREVEVRSNLLSGQHAKHPTTDGLGQILKITIDGMDQAKFKVPRNLKSSSAFEKLWRPTLHVVGAIVYGYYETYFIMNADQRKDSNMNMTIICILFDLLWDDFKDTPHHLPRNLAVGFDNTARESKNQWFALFLAYLRTTRKFDGTGSQNLTMGHSHNRQDQIFSSTATLLSSALAAARGLPCAQEPPPEPPGPATDDDDTEGGPDNSEGKKARGKAEAWFNDSADKRGGMKSE